MSHLKYGSDKNEGRRKEEVAELTAVEAAVAGFVGLFS